MSLKIISTNATSTELLHEEVKYVNAELARTLEDIGKYERIVNNKIYKYYAYRKAAHGLMEYSKKITSGAEAMAHVPGVGKKIAHMIDEYLKTGKIDLLRKEHEDPEFGSINDLVRVDGIGPRRARKFLQMGIKSLKDLQAHTDQLNHHEKIGLKYVFDFETKIPRSEMDHIKDFLTYEIKSIDDKFSVTLCGSYRRGASSSYHVNVLLTHPSYVSSSLRIKQEHKDDVKKEEVKEEPDTEKPIKMEINPSSLTDTVSKKNAGALLDNVVKKLIDDDFIKDTFSFGGTKYLGVCRLNQWMPGSLRLFRRLNIRLIPQDEFFLALLYLTGSFDFCKDLRKIAQKKGFMLNEYCLRHVHESGKLGRPLKVTCEKDVFDYLGLQYQRPEERNLPISTKLH